MKKTFKCKNKTLTAKIEKGKNYRGYPEEKWVIYDGKKWLDQVDYCPLNYSGESLKFYHMVSGKNLTDIKELIDYWKDRYVFPNIINSRGDKETEKKINYSVDTYEISKADFDKLIKNIELLLGEGCVTHYNDEHGVGYFEKLKKNYRATHWRHHCKSTETMTIDKIAEFLRDFFDIGYSYTKNDNWD